MLILTTFDHDEYVYQPCRPGRPASCSRASSPADYGPPPFRDVAAAVRWAPTSPARLIEPFRPPATPHHLDPALHKLSPRESSILQADSPELSDAGVAAALVVSGATIHTHVDPVLSQLGVRVHV